MKEPQFSMVPGLVSESYIPLPMYSYIPLPTYLADDDTLTKLIESARQTRDGDVVTEAFIRSAVAELKNRGVLK